MRLFFSIKMSTARHDFPSSQREKYLAKRKLTFDDLSLAFNDDDNTVTYSPKTLKAYTDTLNEWRARGEQLAFVYDYTTDVYRQRVNTVSIIAFILSSLTAMLTLGSLGLASEDFPIVDIVLKGTSTLFATAATIANGIPHVLHWPDIKDQCQTYSKCVDDLVSNVSTEQSLPSKFRSDPATYIIENKRKYADVLDTAPKIPHTLYRKGINLYRESKNNIT